MNESKKVGRPARRRRSIRKFRRYSISSPAALERPEEEILESLEEQPPAALDESRVSDSQPDIGSPELVEPAFDESGPEVRGQSEEQVIEDSTIELLDDDADTGQIRVALDEEDAKTDPRIDLLSLNRGVEEARGEKPRDDELSGAGSANRLSSTPPSEPRDSSIPSESSVKRTRVISIPPDEPSPQIQARGNQEAEAVEQSDGVAGEELLPDLEIPETNLEEIEALEGGEAEGFEDERLRGVRVAQADISAEQGEWADEQLGAEIEQSADEQRFTADSPMPQIEEAIESEDEEKEELTEADLERAIEWDLSLEEDAVADEEPIDEIDQSDLIESTESPEAAPERASHMTITEPNDDGSIEPERTPLDFAARLSPPPAPPETKTKRISVKPPPHPTGNAQPAPSSASSQTGERAVSTTNREEHKSQARPIKAPRPWWESFFSEDYLRTVMPPSPPQVSRQCDFILESLGLERGSTILDVGCGLGLHAVELTVRGYLVVGLDLSLPMVTRAAEEAQYRGLKINFLHADIRQIEFDGAFDAVICMGTTFGFFDDESNRDVLSRLHGALKAGGKLLLDVVNRDFAIRSQPNLVWFQGDDCVCMEESEFNYSTSRLHVKRTVMQEDGRQSDSEYSIRLYSLHELYALLRQEGFRVMEVSGQEATRGLFFGMNAPRVLILAMRTNQRPSLHDAIKWNSRKSKKPNADNENT
ncbi:MAG: methyltransferase domain-containing protein [Deltaproteobacteria bacterium]|nr:methyltransferase domain-containing protein [Deltaproteobacteria bacterium]